MHAVNGLDLDLRAGEIVGLVGESGSGKSVTSRAIMGLLPRRTAEVSGSVRLDGRELVGLPESDYRRVRGEQVAMIFQDPLTALDPLYRAGEQVAEALRFHKGMSRRSGAGNGSWSCWRRSGCPTRSARPSGIPTSCRAACASG